MLENTNNENPDLEESFLSKQFRKARRGEMPAVLQGLFILLIMAAGFTLGFYTGYRLSMRQVRNYLSGLEDQDHKAAFYETDLTLITSKPAAKYGNPDSPTKVRFFIDLQCPYCGEMLMKVPRHLLDTLKNEVYLEFYDFPIPTHENSTLAAAYARCFVQNGGDYLQFISMIEENNNKWVGKNPSQAEMFFKNAIQNNEQVIQCVSKQETLDTIAANLRDGQAIGIDGTPSYVIGNVLSSGFLEPDSFSQHISNLASIGSEMEISDERKQ